MAPRKQKNITFTRIDTIEFHGKTGNNLMLAFLDEQTYEMGATKKIGIMLPARELKVLSEQLVAIATLILEKEAKAKADGTPSPG